MRGPALRCLLLCTQETFTKGQVHCSVARLEMNLPFYNRLAYNRAHRRSVSPLVGIGMATERSAATRVKDRLSLSRVGQYAGIEEATERSAATRLKMTRQFRPVPIAGRKDASAATARVGPMLHQRRRER